MTAAAPAAIADRRSERGELAQAFVAMRGRLCLVVLLLVLAGAAWWSTADRMAGMDAGPGTSLGALSWFLGVWVVMMAAMMFPSLAPTTALYARMTRQRGLDRALLHRCAGCGAAATSRRGRSRLAGLGRAWYGAGDEFEALVRSNAVDSASAVSHAIGEE